MTAGRGVHRCSACGASREWITVYHAGEWRPIVPACDEHPEAPVLTWTGSAQAAAIWIEQYLHGRSWGAVHAAIETAPDTRRRRTLAAVAPLVERWGGLPERRLT